MNNLCSCTICRSNETSGIPAVAYQFPEGSERRALAIKEPGHPVYYYEEKCPQEAPMKANKSEKKLRTAVCEEIIEFMKAWRGCDLDEVRRFEYIEWLKSNRCKLSDARQFCCCDHFKITHSMRLPKKPSQKEFPKVYACGFDASGYWE